MRACMEAESIGLAPEVFYYLGNSSSSFPLLMLKGLILLRAVMNVFHFYLTDRVTRITICRHAAGVLLMQRLN